MEYEKPATGILLEKDFGDSKFYSISCDCGNPDDTIKVNVDSEDGYVTVHHWVKVKTDWWSSPTKFYFLNSLIHRVKLTWQLWIRGYLEYEAYTMMTKQQAFNYAYTLNQAVKDVEEFRKKTQK